MTTTFSWAADGKLSGTTTFAVLTAQFGDGYKQTAANGINNKSQSWPVKFTGNSAKIIPIRDFLDARAGFESFFWTPPLGVQGYYKCASYVPRHLGGDAYELTATFEQSFQP